MSRRVPDPHFLRETRAERPVRISDEGVPADHLAGRRVEGIALAEIHLTALRLRRTSVGDRIHPDAARRPEQRRETDPQRQRDVAADVEDVPLIAGSRPLVDGVVERVRGGGPGCAIAEVADRIVGRRSERVRHLHGVSPPRPVTDLHQQLLDVQHAAIPQLGQRLKHRIDDLAFLRHVDVPKDVLVPPLNELQVSGRRQTPSEVELGADRLLTGVRCLDVLVDVPDAQAGWERPPRPATSSSRRSRSPRWPPGSARCC